MTECQPKTIDKRANLQYNNSKSLVWRRAVKRPVREESRLSSGPLLKEHVMLGALDIGRPPISRFWTTEIVQLAVTKPVQPRAPPIAIVSGADPQLRAGITNRTMDHVSVLRQMSISDLASLGTLQISGRVIPQRGSGPCLPAMCPSSTKRR